MTTIARAGRLKPALITVPVIVAIGFLMGQLSNSGYGNSWFDQLNKPSFMPPGWAFGAAWTLLYILLGIVLALLLTAPRSRARTTALGLFFFQLVLNFSWSPIFFGLHQVGLALAVIVIILLASVATTFAAARVNSIAPWLMVPYLAWLTFASILNYSILRLN